MKNVILPLTVILICCVFVLTCTLSSAIFEGENIDKKHFPCILKPEYSQIVYRANVVFVGRAANIRFHANQILPVDLNGNSFLTLYLVEDENIDDHTKVILKQVIPPEVLVEGENRPENKPENWEAKTFWTMKLDLSSLD